MQNNSEQDIQVWDPVVRIFHWSLVLSFFAAYLSEDDWLTLHVWSGYVVGGLVGLRLLWGIVGTRYARFSNFVVSPSRVLGYLRDLVRFRATRYVGHNPAGAVMITLMLIALILTTISGLMVYGAENHAGPLAGALAGSSESLAEALEEVHEFFANFTLILVVFHILGVLLESAIHRENLVRAMWTGRKRPK